MGCRAYNMHNQQLQSLYMPFGATEISSCLGPSGSFLLYASSNEAGFNVCSVSIKAIDCGKRQYGIVYSANICDMLDGYPEILFRFRRPCWVQCRPLAFHQTHPDQLYIGLPGMLLLYDLSTRRVKVFEDITNAYAYPYCFACPYKARGWPTEIPAIAKLQFVQKEVCEVVPGKEANLEEEQGLEGNAGGADHVWSLDR